MKHLAGILGLLLIFSMSMIFAQDKKEDKKMMSKSKETTISGEVVDVGCYLKDGAKGADHQACAEACAKAGSALGILTDKGKLYVSIMPDDHAAGPNAKLMDHIGHKVDATGIVRTKGGIQGIMVKDVKMAEMEMKEEKK
jgi:hypothetical protein